ncbi:hypothetical protein CN138_09165 [Sinorhizobium meliloti]|uniref:tail fiber protein n=1 Tax=Rhizobium meliloti TaxID=382 RepID=UPI000FD43A09|nr:tail fiber protein [Sinorhizobium meliloti]RVL48488.1 hypothetical protein CN145_23290 [Sinorhizobium meliloti]RVL72421.1 hypothetical protein CN138_09165 [Sinorhizobium meliloti]
MPRNGSGTASIVNTFTPLTTADANDVNENFTDIATMITDSLPRDGQAGMSGQLLAISGTATEPGIAFNADTNTGIRRPSGGTLALVCGGSDIATLTSTGVAVSVAPTTGDHLTNKTYVDAQIPAATSLVPSGSVMMFAASTAPNGWLECNGAAVSRTTYADLFAVIGTTWGAGDGATTFTVPDLRGEFVRGWDHGKGTDTGRTFGSSQGQAIQQHNHYLPTSTGVAGTTWSLDDTLWQQTQANANPSGAGTPALTFNDASQQSGTLGTFATETRPRNVALMYIIKT